MTGIRQVPWRTALPLALVAALGSEFWVVAVRGAVGATERTSEPFAQWVLDSAVVLPAYLVAVVVALSVARRRYGPGPLAPRQVVGSLLMVVLAATLVAAVLLAVDAVVDYRLQMQNLGRSSAHGSCTDACFAQQHRETIVLQVKAVGLGTVLALVSNVVLLGVLVALRGGRLDLSAGRSAAYPAHARVAVPRHEVLRVVPGRVRERPHRAHEGVPPPSG